MSTIDRDRARAAFAAYVAPYDASSPRIALKVKHTYNVARIGERIAASLGWDAEDVDLAWLCCLLHDIGRFEQLRRWDTFSDARSASHPAIGVRVLFGAEAAGPLTVNAPEIADAPSAPHPSAPAEPGSGRIESFLDTREHDAAIRAAVAYHSDFRLPEGLDARTRALCDIVRDADKVDIFRASGFENTPETVMGVSSEDFLASRVSPVALAAFRAHRCLKRDERETPLDMHLGTVALAFELVYPEAVRIAIEQGYLARCVADPFGLGRPFERAETRETWAEVARELDAWTKERA